MNKRGRERQQHCKLQKTPASVIMINAPRDIWVVLSLSLNAVPRSQVELSDRKANFYFSRSRVDCILQREKGSTTNWGDLLCSVVRAFEVVLSILLQWLFLGDQSWEPRIQYFVDANVSGLGDSKCCRQSTRMPSRRWRPNHAAAFCLPRSPTLPLATP